jgi:hypothetical protein
LDRAKITTAALGAVGALLTNYVAAIYLKMNAAASENLASFHAKLAETHQLMLGNGSESYYEESGDSEAFRFLGKPSERYRHREA